MIKDLKPGDVIYRVPINSRGRLFYDTVTECVVNKVKNKDFVTIIHVSPKNCFNYGLRAVGYYRGSCALAEDYMYCTTRSGFDDVMNMVQKARDYNDIITSLSVLVDIGKSITKRYNNS